MILYDPNWKPETRVVDEVGDLMLKSADYLETHKWAQSSLVLRNGAVCMVGSLIKVESGKINADVDIYDGKHPLTCEAYKRIKDHIGNDPEDYNDGYNRKKERSY